MFVSVIIPNYNHAKYLDERIQSVLNQTYQDFEIIILDDKSNDDSLRVINRYKEHPKVSHIIVNEENSGSPFRQWQKGIELAKGNLVWIAESDDSCMSNMLETLVNAFNEDEDCVLAFCRSMMIDEKGRKIRPAINGNGNEKLKGREFLNKYMSIGCETQNVSSALFRKDAVLKMPPFYAEYKGAGDRMFFSQIAEYGNVAIIDEKLNFFRQHGNNSTNKNFVEGINQREDMRILNYICDNGYANKKETLKRCKYYIVDYIYRYPIKCWALKKELILLWDGSLMHYRKWQLYTSLVIPIKVLVYKFLSSIGLSR